MKIPVTMNLLFWFLSVLSLSIALPTADPVSKDIENISTTTTLVVPGESKEVNVGDQQNHSALDDQQLPAEKRNLEIEDEDGPKLDEDTNSEDEEEILDEGKSPEEFAKVIALGPEDESRIENAVLKAEAYGEPASINDYRYYGGEERRKRTIVPDNVLRSYSRPKREIGLTPDEVIALLALLQEGRQNPGFGRYSGDENTIDETRTDGEDINLPDDYSPNYWWESYDRPRFLQYKPDKRFMISRRKKNGFFGEPKLRAPLYKRAFL